MTVARDCLRDGRDCFQKSLWLAAFRGRHEEVVRILDSLTSKTVEDEAFLALALSSCLQALLYLPWLGPWSALAPRPGRPTSSLPLYWTVLQGNRASLHDISVREVVIQPQHLAVVQHLLYRLLQSPQAKARLPGGLPLLHVLLAAGPVYELPDRSVDLFSLHLSACLPRDPLCPYTGRSALDLALELGLTLQAEQLLVLGHRAQLNLEAQKQLVLSGRVVPRLPSPTMGDPWQGMGRLEALLSMWRGSEKKFRASLAENMMVYSSVMTPSLMAASRMGFPSMLAYSSTKEANLESVLVSTLMSWLSAKLNRSSSPDHPSIELRLSGSVGEGTKVLPLDELDLVLQVKLKVKLESLATPSCSSLNSPQIEAEMTRVSCKQPFPHLARILLGQTYPGLGAAGQQLQPAAFSLYMEKLVEAALDEWELPWGLRVDRAEGRGFLERTGAGLVLSLEYLDRKEEWQGLSVDLVSVLCLGPDSHGALLQGMPRIDRRKLDFLQNNDLLSKADGVIVKNGCWRCSFSFGEKRVIMLNRELYQALKYMNQCYKDHINIPTYCLKEIFCSYMSHSSLRPGKEKLSQELARLVVHAETTDISSPFLASELGSRLQSDCAKLFLQVRRAFPRQVARAMQESKTSKV